MEVSRLKPSTDTGTKKQRKPRHTADYYIIERSLNQDVQLQDGSNTQFEKFHQTSEVSSYSGTMKTCSAASCNNNSLHNTKLTWHSLPKNRWIRDQWIDLLGISELAINSTTRICSSHFQKKDFQHNKSFLKPEVIPSVRLASSCDSPSTVKEEDSDLDFSDDSADVNTPRTTRTKRVMYASVAVKEETPVETTRPSRKAARMAAEKILHTVRKYGGAAISKRETDYVPIHVDLVMECYEDVLTSSQLIAHSKAQQLFDETNRRIRQLRLEKAKFVYSHTEDATVVTIADATTTSTTPPTYKTATYFPGGGRTPRSMLYTNKAKIDEKATIPSSSLAYKVVLAAPPPLTRAPETATAPISNASPVIATSSVTIEEEAAEIPAGDVANSELLLNYTIPNIKGGEEAVTARSLMAIRINTLTTTQDCDLQEQASQLEGIIENEKILEEPIKWFVKLHLVAERPACRFCVPAHCNTGLEEDSSTLDGYVWRCYGCTKSTPVTRLTFFARFTLSLSKLLKLIFHWVIQTATDVVTEEVNGDVYMARTVYRALQDVCTRSLANKSNKIGGRGLVVEVGTAQLGVFFIVGAYDRRTKVTRLKVLSTTVVDNLSNLVQKQLDAWLHSHTVVISSDPKMTGRSRTGLRFQQAKNDSRDLENIMDYLKTYLSSMFGKLVIGQLKLETIQGFLDELQWRTRFGKTAWSCFFNMIKDIGQQSGKKVEMSMYEVDLSRMLNSSKSGVPRLPLPKLGSVTTTKVAYSLLKPTGLVQVRQESSNQVTPSSSIPSSPSSENSSDKQDSLRKSRKRSSDEPAGLEKKKPKADEDEGEVNVILDEYYYARKEQSSTFVEEKGNYMFKCLVCTKLIDNNVKVMKHLMAHIENSRQKNPDLSDLTQCKYCFRDFETPYSMQCHIESVHLKVNDLACQICNQAFPNTAALIHHMKSTHVQSEMPYFCQVCGFRSSFHREVVEHFQQVHNNSDRVLCHYCLKVYQIRFSVAGGVGFVQGFYYHLYKHQMKSTMKKCNSCCLVFFNNVDWKNHKAKDHQSMISLEGVTPMECQSGKLVLVKDPHKKPESKPKVRAAPSSYVSKKKGKEASDFSHVELPEDINTMRCVECNKFIEGEHFEKYVSCGKCRYSTNCCEAFVEHMICMHSTLEKKRYVRFKPCESSLDKEMSCYCGFSSKNGDDLALHMFNCDKKMSEPTKCSTPTAVKMEPEDDSLENGSAFFPPLVVLEEDEEKVLKERFATSGESPSSPQSLNKQQQPEQAQVETTECTKDDNQTMKEQMPPSEKDSTESRPCMLNALGLVRRSSASHREESDNSRETPASAVQGDIDSNDSAADTKKQQPTAEVEQKEDEADKKTEDEVKPPESEHTVS